VLQGRVEDFVRRNKGTLPSALLQQAAAPAPVHA
jgi:hypothetical protein